MTAWNQQKASRRWPGRREQSRFSERTLRVYENKGSRFGTNPNNLFLAKFAAARARCHWPKKYGLHNGLEPPEGLPGVAGAAKVTEIFGTNPKSV